MPAIKFKGVDFIGSMRCSPTTNASSATPPASFVEDNLIPIIEQCNRDGRFPRELVKPMGELGFFGANLKGYGCAGMSNVEYGLVMQELERGDSGVRSFVSVQSALVMYPIYTFGSDEQKEHVAARHAEGRKARLLRPHRARLRLATPAACAPAPSKDGNDYVLNGEKMWITSGTIADVAVVWAKVEDEDDRGSRLPRRDRPSRLQGRRHSRQVVAARLGDLRLLAAGCPRSRVERSAQDRRPEERR